MVLRKNNTVLTHFRAFHNASQRLINTEIIYSPIYGALNESHIRPQSHCPHGLQ